MTVPPEIRSGESSTPRYESGVAVFVIGSNAVDIRGRIASSTDR